jgi:hypothetical protein
MLAPTASNVIYAVARAMVFQAQLIGNRLPDNGTLEEARVVRVCSMAALVNGSECRGRC